MTSHATVDNDKHKISWSAGTTDAARRNTLVSDGPLKVGAGHFFAVVLQRSATAGAVAITYREVEFLLGETFDPSTGLLNMHQGWVLQVSTRCSQLLADADAAGALDWDARFTSVEALRDTLVTKTRRDVPAALRALDVGDVIVEVDADMPDDWWHHITGRALVRQDANATVLWQFRACFAYALCKRDRDDDMYDVILDMMGRGAVKDYDECTNGGIAAHVATLMRNSRFPSGLHIFFSAAEATSEIARRLADSAAARFAPLFDARWRSAFPSLSEALPGACEGHEARDICATLAAALALGSEFTKVVADAAEIAAADALQALDTQELRAASNHARMQAVVRFHRPGGGAGTHGGGNATAAETSRAVESQEQLTSLYGDADFKALAHLLEPLVTTPLDTTAVGVEMAKAFSPAGLIFMNGKAIPIEPFKKLTAVQSPIVMTAVLNAALCIDKAGKARADWGALGDTAHAVKLFKGLFSIGTDSGRLNYWALIKPTIAKREGQHALSTLKAPKRPQDLFTSPDLMRRAETVLVNIFAAIGFVGTGEASYKSFLRWQLAGAEAVTAMPELPVKQGLHKKLLEVAEMAHTEAAQRQQLMLRATLNVAARQGKKDGVRFVASGSGTERLVTEFDTLLGKVQADLELSVYNLSILDTNGPPTTRRGGGRRDDDDTRGGDTAWGRAARTNGIYTNSDTGQILFWRDNNKRGDLCTPASTEAAATVAEDWSGCLAQFAPGGLTTRDRWCHRPDKCASHPRPGGLADDAFDALFTFQKEITEDAIDWTKFKLEVQPTTAGNPARGGAPYVARGGGGARGRGGGGARGRGGGAGKGGGKGDNPGGRGAGQGGRGRGGGKRRGGPAGGGASKAARLPFQGPRR